MGFFRTGMLAMAVIALLVARRVTPFFASRAVAGLDIPKHLESGHWQLAAGMAAITCSLLQWQLLAALFLAASGFIALWQVISWKPRAVLHKPILWILYAGYAGLGIGLVVAAAQMAGLAERPVWAVHIIGIAGFSLLIIGMVTRTALGHLGRPLHGAVLLAGAGVGHPASVGAGLAGALQHPDTAHGGCCLDRGLRRLPVALRADADPSPRRQGARQGPDHPAKDGSQAGAQAAREMRPGRGRPLPCAQ